MNRLFLYPGAPKTATTTLQQAVFQHHSGIFYLGKINKNKVPRGCRNEAVYDVLSQIFWSKTDPKPAQIKAQLEEHVFSQAPAGQSVVASWEALVQNPNFLNILQRFEDAEVEVKLLITLRNPLTWVPSQYLQAVQGQFIHKNRNGQFQGKPFMTLDEYVARWEARRGCIGNRLGYLSNTRQCLEKFGAERVDVLLFEDLRVDAEAYYRKIAVALEIDADETVKLAAGAFSNPRLQRSEVDLARRTAQSAWRRLIWRYQKPAVRRAAMKQVVRMTKDDAPAKVKASDELNEKIIEASRENLNWLNERLDLPFEQYGYPL